MVGTLRWLAVIVVVGLSAAIGATQAAPEEERSPLRVLGDNPRYFERRREPVVLFGSGLWTIIPDASVDIGDHNEWYASRGINANRATLFAFCVQQDVDHLLAPWERTGPGTARDGKPKFDLARWHEPFFARLHEYLSDCQGRDIIVLLQLFDEPFTEGSPERWGMNPFNAENNVNAIPGLPGGDNSGEGAFYDPDNQALMALQDALVLRVLDETAERYDNVIYEIGNEINMDSVTAKAGAWQKHWIDLFRAYEAERRGLELILTNDTRDSLLGEGKGGWGAINHHGTIHANLARCSIEEIVDRIAPAVARDYEAFGLPILNSRPCSDPDRTRYGDVVSEDQGRAVYFSYLFSGGHVIGFRTTEESWKGGEAAERIVRAVRDVADRLPFWEMTPRHDLATGNHVLCLAKDGGPVAVYLPLGGEASVRMPGVEEGARVSVRLYDPRSRRFEELAPARGPAVEITTPTSGEGQDWVVLLDAP